MSTFEDVEKDVESIMLPLGMEAGKEIEEIAKKLHPDAIATMPLYRGCLVLLKQTREEEEIGACSIILYHDPSWMGRERNKDTLPDFSGILQVFGQRSGADLSLNGSVLLRGIGRK